MALVNITGHIQTGVIGVLLILSVLIPNFEPYLVGRFGSLKAQAE